jgi:chemotaxis protein MotB
MAKNAAPAGAPLWMVTFADLMSLLVCFFVLIISFSVPDVDKLKIVAGSMRDAFGFQREIIVTGMVEIDGNPRYEYARDLVPLPVREVVGPIPEDGRDIREMMTNLDSFERRREMATPFFVGFPVADDEALPTEPDAQRDEADFEQQENERFEQLEEELRQAIQSVPELERLVENLQIERAPVGLRVQIVDREGRSMFPLGSAELYEPTRALLAQVAAAIAKLPNKLSISGHTDSIAFRRANGYDNWSLSLDRADATRRTLIAAGLDPSRIATVVGKADTEHRFPDNPLDPRNRRISITLLREQPPTPDEHAAAPE